MKNAARKAKKKDILKKSQISDRSSIVKKNANTRTICGRCGGKMRADVVKRHLRSCGTNRVHGGA